MYTVLFVSADQTNHLEELETVAVEAFPFPWFAVQNMFSVT